MSEKCETTKGRGEIRSKVVTWHDPTPGAALARAMAGIDYLRAVVEGTTAQPPTYSLFGATLVSAHHIRAGSKSIVFRKNPPTTPSVRFMAA